MYRIPRKAKFFKHKTLNSHLFKCSWMELTVSCCGTHPVMSRAHEKYKYNLWGITFFKPYFRAKLPNFLSVFFSDLTGGHWKWSYGSLPIHLDIGPGHNSRKYLAEALLRWLPSDKTCPKGLWLSSDPETGLLPRRFSTYKPFAFVLRCIRVKIKK